MTTYFDPLDPHTLIKKLRRTDHDLLQGCPKTKSNGSLDLWLRCVLICNQKVLLPGFLHQVTLHFLSLYLSSVKVCHFCIRSHLASSRVLSVLPSWISSTVFSVSTFPSFQRLHFSTNLCHFTISCSACDTRVFTTSTYKLVTLRYQTSIRIAFLSVQSRISRTRAGRSSWNR